MGFILKDALLHFLASPIMPRLCRNHRDILRGLTLAICLWFGLGESRVQAGCGDHVVFNGGKLPGDHANPGIPTKEKRCSGFLCSNNSPLLPSVPTQAPEWFGEKLLLISLVPGPTPVADVSVFAADCLVFLSPGFPWDIFDPPRS